MGGRSARQHAGKATEISNERRQSAEREPMLSCFSRRWEEWGKVMRAWLFKVHESRSTERKITSFIALPGFIKNRLILG